MLNTDEIRKEVAVRHGLILDDNDPALELVKINDIVLERCLETLLAKNEEHQKALTNAVQVGIADAKRTAGTVITDAADYVSEQVHTAATSAMQEAKEDILNSAVLILKETRTAMKLALYASVATATIFTANCVLVLKNYF